MLASMYGGKWRIMRQRTEASDAERDVFSGLSSLCFRRSRAELFVLLSGIMGRHI